jgi:hypothetical protein
MKLTNVLRVVLGGFVLGVVLGVVIHVVAISIAYYSLKSDIAESRFADVIFRQDPSIGELYFTASNHYISRRNLGSSLPWRIFVNLGILEWNTDTADVSSVLSNALQDEKTTIRSITTIRHLIRMAGHLGNSNNGPEYEDRLANLIAANLANGPKSYETYRDAVASDNLANGIPDYSENKFSFLAPRQILPLLWGEKANQSDVINLLFLHTGIAEKFDALPGGKQDNHLTPAESYRQIEEYFQRMMISINDDPNVRSSKNWLTILEGPEQFFMYIVFSIGLMLLLQNAQYLNQKIQLLDDRAKFSVIFYRWVQIALPSLGFIGTKRGLSEALGKADTIVRASTQVNQALAVTNVSETMGIAFTSTLVGLILLLILLVLELRLRYKRPSWNE